MHLILIVLIKFNLKSSSDLLSQSAFSASQTSYNPPLPPDDHWGLNIPLPKYEKVYVLKRNRGMVSFSPQ